MRPVRSSTSRRRAAGFTLVELMIGVVIGLLASLAVTQVLVSSEGQKRSTTTGSDAQINGALALHAMQRAIAPAGYGFTSNTTTLGCPMGHRYNGGTVTGFPTALDPVTITPGVSGAPDTIRILASSKTSYSLPLRVVSPGYVPTNPTMNTAFPVSSVRSVQGPRVDGGGNVIEPGELMVGVIDSTQPCQVFQVTAAPGSTPSVERVNQDAKWNLTGFPNVSYPNGATLVNLGTLMDRTYSISASNTLQVTRFAMAADSSPSYVTEELFGNIVQLRALYGKDANADGAVDTWDSVKPTTALGWSQLLAVRLALVARTEQYEKDEVTSANPQWNVGNAITITGTVACGASQCLDLKVDGLTDWKHYRYKVFETIVPMRNLIWGG